MGYGRVCMVACQDGFTLPSTDSYEKLYVCGASGSWIHPAPLPDCSGNYDLILFMLEPNGKTIIRNKLCVGQSNYL